MWFFVIVVRENDVTRIKSMMVSGISFMRVTSFVTFNIISNGNVKFRIHKQILPLCSNVMSILLMVSEMTAHTQKAMKPYTFIDNPFHPLPWMLISRFDSHSECLFLTAQSFPIERCDRNLLLIHWHSNIFTRRCGFMPSRNIRQAFFSRLSWAKIYVN